MTAAQPILPVDVAAYLIQAAEALAEKKGFVPQSIEEMSQWLSYHTQEIGTLAKSAMQEFVSKMLSNEKMMDAACEHVGAQVHAQINAQKSPSKAKSWNPRYLAYCKSQGVDNPDEMMTRDGGSMVNYLCWKSPRIIANAEHDLNRAS